MRTSLRQSQGHSLSMTPQLVQSIRLLQLSAQELDQEILQALESNVMLESAEGSEDAETSQDETAAPEEAPVDASDESDDREDSANDEVEALETKIENLEIAPDATDDTPVELSDEPLACDTWTAGRGREMPESALPESDRGDLCAVRDLELALNDPMTARLATAIIESIDDRGYLGCSLEDVQQQLAADVKVSLSDLERVLGLIQRVEGNGYAARDLRECLLIQLDAMSPQTPGHRLARLIVSEHLGALASQDLASYTEQLQSSAEPIAVAVRLIRSLSPKPVDTRSEPEYIVPDLALRRSGNHWKLFINRRGVPRVRINKTYERLLGKSAEGGDSLRQQLQEARWLIRGLEMRNDTLLRAAQVIFDRQKDFLERGDEGLKPLTLKTVADAIGMHESTLSRITTRKYVQTPRGVFELKRFFAGSLTASNGVEASGLAVRATIRRFIERESAPLCDGDIAALLARQGIHIARRTVAKYRESMNIPSAKARGLTAHAAAA